MAPQGVAYPYPPALPQCGRPSTAPHAGCWCGVLHHQQYTIGPVPERGCCTRHARTHARCGSRHMARHGLPRALRVAAHMAWHGGSSGEAIGGAWVRRRTSSHRRVATTDESAAAGMKYLQEGVGRVGWAAGHAAVGASRRLARTGAKGGAVHGCTRQLASVGRPVAVEDVVCAACCSCCSCTHARMRQPQQHTQPGISMEGTGACTAPLRMHCCCTAAVLLLCCAGGGPPRARLRAYERRQLSPSASSMRSWEGRGSRGGRAQRMEV